MVSAYACVEISCPPRKLNGGCIKEYCPGQPDIGRAAVGTEFLSPYPNHIHTHGDPHWDPIPTADLLIGLHLPVTAHSHRPASEIQGGVLGPQAVVY